MIVEDFKLKKQFIWTFLIWFLHFRKFVTNLVIYIYIDIPYNIFVIFIDILILLSYILIALPCCVCLNDFNFLVFVFAELFKHLYSPWFFLLHSWNQFLVLIMFKDNNDKNHNHCFFLKKKSIYSYTIFFLKICYKQFITIWNSSGFDYKFATFINIVTLGSFVSSVFINSLFFKRRINLW